MYTACMRIPICTCIERIFLKKSVFFVEAYTHKHHERYTHIMKSIVEWIYVSHKSRKSTTSDESNFIVTGSVAEHTF